MDVALGHTSKVYLGIFTSSLNPCCNGCRTWTGHVLQFKTSSYDVLILVVMDVALGRNKEETGMEDCEVLILVVMDVALGQRGNIIFKVTSDVLILVVMDVAL